MYWRDFKLVEKLPEVGEYAVLYILSSEKLIEGEDVVDRLFTPNSGDTEWQYHHDGKWREVGKNPWGLDHMKSLECLEERLVELNELCAQTTGLESYPTNDIRRKAVLDDLQTLRTLTREEFINLYNYGAWRRYVEYHNLPENHPLADLPNPSEREKSILSRLRSKVEGPDAESIKKTIKELIEEGWEDSEIIKFCNYTEEVSPLLDEETALNKMRILRESVEKRTGKTHPRCCKKV